MFRGFNLSLKNSDYSAFKPCGDRLTSAYRKAVQNVLDYFITDTGVIDGSKLQEDWFPQVKADVFISHSHNDEEIAIALAGWLKKTFQLTTFIDSCVWGYSDDLLKRIDDRYCLNSDKTYDYEKIKGSTSHIHMMLSTALGMMIDNTECLIFLNTPRSITSNDVVSKTQSPWLYMEIAIAKIIRRKTDRYHRQVLECAKDFRKPEAKLNIEYTLDMTPLMKIDQLKLHKWEIDYKSIKLNNQPQHPLDTLYNIMPSTKLDPSQQRLLNKALSSIRK